MTFQEPTVINISKVALDNQIQVKTCFVHPNNLNRFQRKKRCLEKHIAGRDYTYFRIRNLKK